jgi:succinate-semialdehyde dehydrogenase/glutarate-semialdehyde dehydrogenase
MFKSINPATGDEIGTYPELTSEELEGKVARAASRFASWRFSPVPERTQLLEKIAEIFDTRLEPMARMASAEMGKTLVSARAEVQKCAAAFRYYAQNGEAFLKPRPIAGAKGEVHLLPLGVILAVMPWNFPYWQAVRFLAPTILAGNVGLLKHASIVQGVAGMIEEAVIAAGAPDGLFQNLAIKSGNVAALIADERVAAVTLTGSEGAGRSVAVAAGGALKKAVLELGGSDPFIVMPSADLDLAVKAAVTARIQNSGQSCVCAKRMIVHADVYDAFAERFIAGMLATKAGDPMDPASDMGPLSSFEQMDTVLGQLEEAKAAGATLIGGGVLTGVPLDSKLAHEEIFGPIAMLFKVADIDEAIRLANAIPFGLGSSVWTREPAEEARFIVGIEAGMTAVNQILASAPEAPFGGIKRSGHGRELGQWGLHEFMNVKTVLRSGTSGGPDRS